MVVFGCTLNELAVLHYKPIPSFLEKCFAFLLKNGIDKEGIFRISGDIVELKNLQTKIDATNDIDLSDSTNPFVVANIITRFFRFIPGHVLIDTRADEWMNVRTADDAKRLFNLLPLINRAVLSRFMAFLTIVKNHSDRNRMGSQALSVVVSPNLIEKPGSPEFLLPNEVVMIMIDNYDNVFDSMPALNPSGEFQSDEEFSSSIGNVCMEFFCKSSPVSMKLKPIDEEKQCRLDRNIHINKPNYNDTFQELLAFPSKTAKASSHQPIVV